MRFSDATSVARFTTSLLRGLVLIVTFAHAVQAQEIRSAGDSAPPPAANHSGPSWLTDVRTHFTFDKLKSSDPDFKLAADIGLGVTIWSDESCRWMFDADHEGIMGRSGDPVKLDIIEYGFEMSGACGPVRVFVRHRCRHESDQYNPLTVSWNTMGIEIGREFKPQAGWVLMATINVQDVVSRYYVDYGTVSELHLGARRTMSKTASVYGAAFGTAITVVPTALPPRNTQLGASFETGVRLDGARGSVDFFVGYSRLVDAFTTGRKRERFVSVGLRISSK
jgi:hypothetical protein